MSKRTAPLLISFLAILLPLLPACHRADAPPVIAPNFETKPELFSKVNVGDHLRTVRTNLGSIGDLRKAEGLPGTPKPLELYPKLPLDTQYWFWETKENSRLILGISPDDRVIFKEIAVDKEGGTTVNAQIDERYQ
jgi:hypothetical protein